MRLRCMNLPSLLDQPDPTPFALIVDRLPADSSELNVARWAEQLTRFGAEAGARATLVVGPMIGDVEIGGDDE